MINNRTTGRRRGRGGARPNSSDNSGSSNRGASSGSRLDSRARGNAHQLLEKYKSLARDAQNQGDRVVQEYYLQFADHYFRMLSETNARRDEQRRQNGDAPGDYRDDEDGYDQEAAVQPELAPDREDQSERGRSAGSGRERRPYTPREHDAAGGDVGARAAPESRPSNDRDTFTDAPSGASTDHRIEIDRLPAALGVSLTDPGEGKHEVNGSSDGASPRRRAPRVRTPRNPEDDDGPAVAGS